MPDQPTDRVLERWGYVSAHIPSQPITVGTVRRQRCGWCGALLSELDLARVHAVVADGEQWSSIAAPRFAVGKWVEFQGLRDGGAYDSMLTLGDHPPDSACCRSCDA